MGGGRRRSLPTIDISPSDSDVEIVSEQKPGPALGNTDGPSMAAFPLTRPSSKHEVWSGPPGESGELDIEIDEAESPPPRPPRGRSILSKVIFLAIFSVALTLLACEISIAFKVPWLDPRPVLVNVQRFAVAKLAKLHGR
jgi:hypothetical protein